MSVSAPPTPPRTQKPRRSTPAVPLLVLPAAAAAAGAAWAAAPEAARSWTATLAVTSWLCVAVSVCLASHLVGRARRTAAARRTEIGALRAQLAQENAALVHLVNVALPGVAQQVRDGTGADEAVARTAPASGPHLRQVVQSFATLVEDAVRQAADAESRRQRAEREERRGTAELEHLTNSTLPAAVEKLRDGTSAEIVLAELEWPRGAQARACAELFVRELARSERRTHAAQAASAKSLSRVQAKAVSMLADLRDMQDRHGEEVLGDLLRLDHSTSQLGLITDRLALLMGGRSSRAWNRPIVMESILRGAVGRIAAYQRVRMHCSTDAAISGYAAEGVMHLLAELMDNAANFSPPIDEVHVYVEERTAGIVVTIEDSGLKMADAAMRHAEQAVSGRTNDLASLQGTRLGLAVVGRLAAKYGVCVSYRPSSRGGTGVVVLVPPQLLAQQRDPAPALTGRTLGGRGAATVPGPAPAAEAPPRTRRVPDVRPAERTGPPQQAVRPGPAAATPGGLPMRSPGRTMAEAEAEREHRAHHRPPADPPASAPRDAGASFGAFHRGRRSGATGAPETERPAPG
ncbi:signal transduction histidine kinase [Streptomyces sp. BK208]|uniref:sensor histidine kinase n=1 Tax=Streptomyces sp. BK208 TaxID=2512150 RepID=UPI0010603AE5|nr:ATP-binding protein [Streptomyces sp. BK208]TDT42320.1 signal transduction histidine kinase [Streptomyces sp. BK208]